MIENFIHNNEANQERINKTTKNTTHFISTIKTSLSSLSNISIRNKNEKAFCDLSSLSQAYGVSHSRLRHHYGLRQKIVWHSGMNEWKNWLRSRYQYDLVQNRWLKLVPRQWRNRMKKKD
ncbi:hypothetical protein ES288_D03G100700v1 [Gossypium darwinii]|uniref:Uncharacterized protein n=1 Tax=Gossypium darwinii TaxID=34276 RepID=A0A5D2D5A2_GOSDA|nr:hypothetical protein ES288_D03G100700v1 [Gossypium darwinii]